MDVDELPKLQKWSAPTYPPRLRNEGYAGSVIVQYIVTEEGRVDRPKVLSSSHPSFSDAVIGVVGGWVYQPAVRDGKPVAVRVAIPVAFTMDE
jgi:periplasmic protein TonB